jgi:hydrogenase maturation factor
MGPRPTDPTRFQKIMQQTCEAANEHEIAIVRGHTGMYDSLKDLVGVCTVYGTVKPERLITSGGAKPGDLLLCTKPLGAETVTNYCINAPRKRTEAVWHRKTANARHTNGITELR